MIRRARRLGLVVVAGVAALLATGCTPDSPPDPTPSDPSTGGIDWQPCDPGFECAQVAVPLDWSDPDGESIELAVIRHPASGDDTIGTLFFNPGGPGESGVDAVRSGGDDLDAWGGGRFDVVGWEPRGTNASTPIDCFADAAETADFWDGAAIPATDAEGDRYATRLTDLAGRCEQAMGDVLAHVSTADTVRDLDRLRELVGDEQLTFVGLSYGTLIGQLYANEYPDRVRAMVLDGVVDAAAFTRSAEARAASGSSSADAVFDEFLTLCEDAGGANCALAGHDEPVEARVDRLFAQAASGELAVTSPDLAGVISGSLTAPAQWPSLAALLDAAVDGDTGDLESVVAQHHSPEFAARLTVAAGLACADGPAERPVDEWPEVLGELQAESRIAGAFQGWWQWAPCAAGWPPSADRYPGGWDAATENPLLLIGTRFDPATAYANAVAAEGQLGNATLLTLDGYGHISVADPSACIDEARTRYLVDLEAPARGTVCAPDQTPFG